MSTSLQNDSHHPRLCRLSCSCITNTPPRVPYFGLFWGPEKPLCRNWKIFHRCTHAESASRLLLQIWLKSVEDKWPKGCVALITGKKQNTFWHPEGEPPGRFLPFSASEVFDILALYKSDHYYYYFSCLSAHRGPSLIFQISSR